MRFLALLLVTTLYADRQVGVELLYWKPTTGSFAYAVDQIPTLQTVQPHLRVGVRGFTSLCCLHLSGLYFRTTSDASARGSLSPAFGLPVTTEVKARLIFCYWHGDLRLNYAFVPWMSAFAAVRYVGLEERQQVGVAHQLLQLFGAGPGFGVASRVSLSDAFFFDAQMTGYALVAERKTTNYAHTITILPALDLRLAFRYVGCWFSGALGYSLDYIFDAVSLRLPLASSPQRTLRDTGFAGPFAQVSLPF